MIYEKNRPLPEELNNLSDELFAPTGSETASDEAFKT